MALDVCRVLTAPLDLAILQIHEVPSVFLYHRLHAISIKETLFASRFPYRGHDSRRIFLYRVEFVQGTLDLTLEVNFVEIDRSESALRGDEQMVAVATEWWRGPI